jgi:hypothetical protein
MAWENYTVFPPTALEVGAAFYYRQSDGGWWPDDEDDTAQVAEAVPDLQYQAFSKEKPRQ